MERIRSKLCEVPTRVGFRPRSIRRCRTATPGSPLMRSIPQTQFSLDMVMMRSRVSGLRCGRPPQGRDFQRQNRRQLCRCQRTTVSGVTNLRCSRQQAHQRRASTQSSSSHVQSRVRGRVRVGRLRTASWWCRSRFSSTRSWRGRTQTRMVVSRSRTSSSTPSASPITVVRGFALPQVYSGCRLAVSADWRPPPRGVSTRPGRVDVNCGRLP